MDKDKRPVEDELLALLRDPLLSARIEVLHTENASLKDQMHTLEERVSDLETDMKQQKKMSSKRHFRLLLGSVAFNFTDAAVLYIFGPGFPKGLHTRADIEGYHKTEEQAAKWTSFCELYWTEEIDGVVRRLKGDRLPLACPITLEEDDEEDDGDLPTPQELQDIAKTLYNSKKSKPIYDLICTLVDHLDTVKRDLGRPLLE